MKIKASYFLQTVFFIALSCYSYAQDEKPAKQEIKSVTVFLSSAQVQSTTKLSLEAGVTEVVFQDLPANINKQSIQLSGTGDFTILAVHTRSDFLKSPEKKAKIKALEDSLTFYTDKLETEQIRKFALDQEESLILSNKNMSGDKGGATAVDVEDMAQLYRTRLPELKTEAYKLIGVIKKLQEKVSKIKRQITEVNDGQTLNTTEIIATVSCKRKVSATFDLIYITYSAGWAPVYDIRSENISSPIQLSYKAQVYQSTGTDWTGIKLTLSTGNPSESGTKPELQPWMLDFQEIGMLSYSRMDKIKPELQLMESAGKTSAFSPADFTTMNETAFARLFEINQPYTIPSGSKPSVVEIQKFELEAAYKLTAVPKLDQAAFLIAEIRDWEKLGLVSAPANVFFDGAFVSESYINTLTTGDTLKISLGKDKGIIAKREKIKDLSSEKSVGSTKKVALAYDITIRNTKKQEVELYVEDQLPIVQNKDIELKILDLDGAKYDDITGKLTWKIKLDSAEEKKFRFAFEVKYPKDKFIPGL